MLHFMAAVASADADMPGRFNSVRCPLIIQNLNGIGRRERRLMHKYPAKLGFAGGKEIFYEILFHIQILVQKLREVFLIDIGAHPHE